ncbi:MAG TPA: galactose-1-phosphate uridylyltransferase [Myxococcales bacterium]|jgi:UDPglucose--hexose-1-phosphate uridylyltransferase|nr:galactose-1-phosphate uridylyltransferase [Myxococcales bacterium]
MPELRKDPIIGRWVIIATERAKRPTDFQMLRVEQKGGFCPFCPGNEEGTPPEVLAYRPGAARPNGPGWSLRVVPNRFPALMIEGSLNREGDGIYDKMSGIGAHEVIIETADHSKGLASSSEKEVEDVLWAWRDRISDLRRDTRFRYVLIFKNHGEAAGASLEHSHSQLIALPIVPRRVTDEMEGARRHFESKERCIYCDIVRQEKKEHARIVYENEEMLVVAPWAPRRPFETWILPKNHVSNFEDSQKSEFRGLANALRTTLRKLDAALENPPFNFILHTSPLNQRGLAHYHWHVELMPTLTKVAGFESGSGFYINPTPPEEAAAFLRRADGM